MNKELIAVTKRKDGNEIKGSLGLIISIMQLIATLIPGIKLYTSYANHSSSLYMASIALITLGSLSTLFGLLSFNLRSLKASGMYSLFSCATGIILFLLLLLSYQNVKLVCDLNQVAFAGCNDFTQSFCAIYNDCTTSSMDGQCNAPPVDMCTDMPTIKKMSYAGGVLALILNLMASMIALLRALDIAISRKRGKGEVVMPSFDSNESSMAANQNYEEVIKRLTSQMNAMQERLQLHDSRLRTLRKAVTGEREGTPNGSRRVIRDTSDPMFDTNCGDMTLPQEDEGSGNQGYSLVRRESYGATDFDQPATKKTPKPQTAKPTGSGRSQKIANSFEAPPLDNRSHASRGDRSSYIHSYDSEDS